MTDAELIPGLKEAIRLLRAIKPVTDQNIIGLQEAESAIVERVVELLRGDSGGGE
jgi:hypothetical protein